MRNINFFLIFVILSSVIYTSCNLDEDQIVENEITVFNISDDFQDWLTPFDSVGREIQYTNDLDSISVIAVERTFTESGRNYVDCTIEDQPVDCEFNSINIAFPEDTHPENYQAFISIFLFAPNDLQVMANRVGVSPAIARVNEETGEFRSEFTNNYMADYQPDYDFNGIPQPAIIIETTTLENAPDGAIIAPKRMVLVKGVGVTEWEDFSGNDWKLSN